jgi:hypothetical protein
MSIHSPSFKSVQIRSGLILGAIILIALLAFEAFNYSTTQYALSDLLGSLTFIGVPWATILSIAFCGIDFAGIARLFAPGQERSDPNEVWYLFGAWLLAATMNAILTWWGVSMAIVNHTVRSNAIVASATISQVVPIFVAIMVWVIRILIIGTISASVDRYQNRDRRNLGVRGPFQAYTPARQSLNQNTNFAPRPAVLNNRNAVTRRIEDDEEDEKPSRIEPTYHTVAAVAKPASFPQPAISEPNNHRTKVS